jgi:hypothetical protein
MENPSIPTFDVPPSESRNGGTVTSLLSHHPWQRNATPPPAPPGPRAPPGATRGFLQTVYRYG